MTSTTTSAEYPMLFSRTASMTSGNAYEVGYGSGTLTYNPYTKHLKIGSSSNGTITIGVNNTITGNYNSSSTSTNNYISISTPGGVRCSTGFYETSDERLKDFKEDIQVDFEKLRSIPKKYFSWKEDDNGQIHIGTSAQKLKEFYPELVTENEDGSLTVSYNKLSMIALKAIDLLDERCTKLEKRLNKLETLINNIE